MRQSAAQSTRLRSAVERSGYYPALVLDSLQTALGNEAAVSFFVHHEATFDREELRRHITVLVLTATRLVVAHVDEHPPDEESPVAHASTSTEAVRIDQIQSVVVTRVIPDPAKYSPRTAPTEVVLTLGWGAVNRIDLEPARCADPTCDADHGYTGAATNDDFTVRVSETADGADVVAQALEFAAALSELSAR
ncbi:MAG: phosphodiesterase [Actinobacteria bacterium]|nr:phosphodiesterase [Actinomycetota bacterium]MCB9412742.1 phosphodiesterase [Actinomycetota bacterium]